MQWILVLLIFSNETTGLAVPSTMAMTSISGFLTQASCVAVGEAWEHTQKTYDRKYECLPADQK
jgi:hypothetical protein